MSFLKQWEEIIRTMPLREPRESDMPTAYDEPGPTITTNSTLPQFEDRIVDWISRELTRCKDEAGRVSAEDAERIAIAAGNRVIRAMGGL